MLTHTHYSQHAKNVGNNSFQYLTFRAAQWPLGHYFASKCTLWVKAETFVWQEKRRCSFMWPFLAARKGTLFLQAGVWCGQGNASPPLPVRSFQDTPKGGSTSGWPRGSGWLLRLSRLSTHWRRKPDRWKTEVQTNQSSGPGARKEVSPVGHWENLAGAPLCVARRDDSKMLGQKIKSSSLAKTSSSFSPGTDGAKLHFLLCKVEKTLLQGL